MIIRIIVAKGVPVSYINVGAKINGARVKSKKMLKETLASNPAMVMFDSTSPMGRQYNGHGAGIPADVTLSVVGPDPYTRRTWYASVTRTADGVIRVA